MPLPPAARSGSNQPGTRSAVTLIEVLLALALLVWVIVSPVTFLMSAGFLVATSLWSFLCIRAPQATVSGTVLIMLAFALIAPLPGYLVQNREAARRNMSRDISRKLGLAIQDRMINSPQKPVPSSSESPP